MWTKIFKRIPFKTRHTFYYDFKSAIYFGIYNGAVAPFVAIIGRKLGATYFQIALLSAAPFVAYLFTPLWTYDPFKKGRIFYIKWSGIIGRGMLFFLFFITQPTSYVFIFFLFFFFVSISLPFYAGVMKSNYPDRIRGRLMGYVRVGIAIPWIAASYLTGLILEKNLYFYRYIFPLSAIFGILSAITFGRIKEQRKEKAELQLRGLIDILKVDRVFSQYLIVFFIFEFATMLAMPLYPIFLVDIMHIPNYIVGIMGAVYSLFWALAYLLWGGYLDRIHPLRGTALILFLTAFIPLGYFINGNFWIIGLAYAFMGISAAGLDLATLMNITYFSNISTAPKYMALHTTLSGIRGLMAPFLGIFLASLFGARPVFIITTLFVLFSAYLCSQIRH